MKKLLSIALGLGLMVSSAMGQDEIPAEPSTPPPVAQKVKDIIASFGADAKILTGYCAVADSVSDWEFSPCIGLQGTVLNKKLRLPFATETTLEYGIAYLYATSTDLHLVGLSLSGKLIKLPDVLNDTKENIAIVNKLPLSLESLSWFVSVGSVADDPKPYLAGGVSFHW